MHLDQDEKIELLRYCIKNAKPVMAIARKLPRICCPHVLGTRNGRWRVAVWQFDGYSNAGDLPNWRYFALDEIDEIKILDGPWHRGSIRRNRPKVFSIDYADTVADEANLGYIDYKFRASLLPRIF